MTITITPSITLAEEEIEEKFVRSPGPGGQNVNKVETAVQLRFDAANSPALSRPVFYRLKRIAGHRMTLNGVIVITANRFRSQDRNRKDALDRLIELIQEAAIPPKPRRKTKPTKAAKQRRLEGKRQRSGIKKNRGKVGRED